jgi:hypothetical protein
MRSSLGHRFHYASPGPQGLTYLAGAAVAEEGAAAAIARVMGLGLNNFRQCNNF